MPTRPNILFAVADDASHMSAYGHQFVNTPHFDAVAEHGLLFNNAFTTNPKCAPSRASILTGMHTWQLKDAGNHFGTFPAKFAVFPDLLESAGYHVGYTGKGWGPGDWRAGGRDRNPAGPCYNSHVLTPPAETGIRANDYAANFEHFLRDRPSTAPFLFWYGGHEPHRPYRSEEGMRAGKDRRAVEVPPDLPDHDIVRSDLSDYAYEIEWFDRHLGLILSALASSGELANTLVVVTSDNGMPFPRVKGQMYEQDFRLPMAMSWGDTVVGGRVTDDLVSFIDLAPTFLEAAGLPQHRQMEGRSLMPLLESGASGRIDPSRDCVLLGRERHDLGREGDVGYPVRCIRTADYLYVRNFCPDRWPAGNPQTGFTNVDESPTKTFILDSYYRHGCEQYFQLAFGKRPTEELYAIKNDPHCLTNLADDSDFDSVRRDLWRTLQQKLWQTSDPRISGSGDVFDSYPYVGSDKNSWKRYLDRSLANPSYPEHRSPPE